MLLEVADGGSQNMTYVRFCNFLQTFAVPYPCAVGLSSLYSPFSWGIDILSSWTVRWRSGGCDGSRRRSKGERARARADFQDSPEEAVSRAMTVFATFTEQPDRIGHVTHVIRQMSSFFDVV